MILKASPFLRPAFIFVPDTLYVFLRALPLIIMAIALAACDDTEQDEVVGPEDYVHFSDTFTMTESVEEDMLMDGGGPLEGPPSEDPNADLLTAEALPGDELGRLLTEKPQNSASIESVQ